MRKLASVQKVLDILPIEGADSIEVVLINGWKVISKKGEFQKGDLCIYFEIDSFLPIRDEFEFLRKSSFKRMDNREGFRLKTIRLRGQISQGLVLPIDVVSNFGIDISFISEDMDLTDALGVVKYEPPIPAELAGRVEGAFPSFLRKTDQERVQNIKPDVYSGFITDKIEFYVTEKLDGSSATFFVKDGVFGVCSRNWQLAEPEERPYPNTFWKVAEKLDLKSKMLKTGRNIALQGELIGEGIQGNRYKIKGQDVRFFNAYDIDTRMDLNFQDFISILSDLELTSVPILYTCTLTSTVEDLIVQAEGKSDLCKDAEREGLVIRSLDSKISFKAISNKFLLREND